MRGKVQHTAPAGHTSGITPAHAGKSMSHTKRSACYRDHPRACGEKFCVATRLYHRLGSPPRMRGKVSRLISGTQKFRITPAHAGKRSVPYPHNQQHQDHPRACGEKIASCTVDRVSMGSPPRMRGKDRAGLLLAEIYGITPAHAGKRTRLCATPYNIRDHPRACGEKTKKIP